MPTSKKFNPLMGHHITSVSDIQVLASFLYPLLKGARFKFYCERYVIECVVVLFETWCQEHTHDSKKFNP